MITAIELEVRVSAQVLLERASFRIGSGDKVGLVGRNGAGKTTLTRILAGEAQPGAGSVTRTGPVGYLPQDPRAGDPEGLARDRILGARGLDTVVTGMRRAEQQMASTEPDEHERGMRRYSRLENEFLANGGYAAESEAATIAASLGLPERVLGQQLRTLSGGQRRRVELARILFSDAETLLLDEPTNHLDADSIVWLRDFLRAYRGGVVVISHDVALLDQTVNKVFHLDATRAALDVYNVGWRTCSNGRPMSAAGTASAPTPRRRRQRSRPRPTGCATRRRRRSRHRTWNAGRSACWPAWTSSGEPRRWPDFGSRTRLRAAARR
jgi:ATPase subunit of ABC transporter with duplicated ATPase domains